MKRPVSIAHYALRTLAAKDAPSVKKVYAQSILKLENAMNSSSQGYYIGVKDTDVISIDFKRTLEESGMFVHTVDAMANGGRAIDIELLNPITGRHMTGSSSGTAINVFKGINDIGIGTDGGGSVLAPALALNLYAMISPSIDQHALRKYSKTSTDGITFSPSIGFMAKTIDFLSVPVQAVIPEVKRGMYSLRFAISDSVYHQPLIERFKELDISVTFDTSFSYEGINRQVLMEELRNIDFDTEILISCEGPVDIDAYGDSVMGHYDSFQLETQSHGHKYYLKVVNMLGLSAVIVPTSQCSTGYLIVCKSTPEAIWQALDIARQIPFERSKLEETYFDCTKFLIKEGI